MAEVFDKRRRQYVPLSVAVAHDDMAANLKRKFGRDGVLVWILYLAACKTNWVQGQLDYTSEPDGWTKLGLYGHQPRFTLAEFFGYTGSALHATTQRRQGDLISVVCRKWNDWNKDFKRQRDAEEKSSKRGGNTTTTGRQTSADASTNGATEVEVDLEVENPLNPLLRKKSKPCPECGVGGLEHQHAVDCSQASPGLKVVKA